MNAAEQQGMPFAMTIGAGRKNAQGQYYPVKPSVEAVAEALRQQPDGFENWFSLHLWQKNYRTESNWLASSGVVIDVDYDIPKVPAPDNLQNQLLSLATDGDLPGSIFYLTPRGCRVIWVYDRPCSERETQQKAEQAAGAQLAAIIPGAYHVDEPLLGELARFFYTPNCTAKDIKRSAEVIVMRQDITDPFLLATQAPAPKPVAVSQPARAPISLDLASATERWNSDHEESYPRDSGDCPMCGHSGCFGRFPDDDSRWFCWSTDHSSGGIQSAKGWHGDALDIEAHRRGVKPTELLKSDGYLARSSNPDSNPTKASTTSDTVPAVARFRTVEEVILSEEFKRPRTTTPTGISDFDHLIGGGFKSRQLVVFAAPTGKGKTGLAGSIAYILSCTPLPVLWITTELDDNEQAARFASIAGRMTGSSNATPDDFLSLRLPPETAVEPMKGKPLCLVNLDDPDADVLAQIRVEVEGVVARFGRTPIIVIDYLQVMAPEDPTQRRMSVSKVANRLRRIAQDFDTTVIAISSVSRAYYGKKDKKVVVEEEPEEDPRDWIAAAKESGDIEYACSVFGYLDTAHDMNSLGESEARLIVAKSRTGVPGFVGLRFHGPSGLFVPANEALALMRPTKRQKGPPDSERVMDALRKLQRDPPSLSMLRNDVKGIRATSVDAAVRALIDKGVIEVRDHRYENAAGAERTRRALVVVEKVES